MIRMAPRTPKPGSSLVSRVIGGGVGVADSDSVEEDEEDEEVPEEVGVRVRVTLKVVGRTPTMTVFWFCLRVVMVVVTEAVVKERDKVGDGGGSEVDDCAATRANRAKAVGRMRKRMVGEGVAGE